MTAGLSELLAKDADNQDPGRVINISSTASVEPSAEGALSAGGNGTWSCQCLSSSSPSSILTMTTDQPSKAAVNHLTSTLAVKLMESNITVNAICPGLFPSKMTAFGLRNADKTLMQNQPTGRYGQPSDIAGLALFLSSPASAHVTGSHILIDGGSRFRAHAVAPSVKL
jgi:NAD(P)-dependent dehydrogenase (short-subunit alcohol dehydrogenase family)